MRAIWKYEPPAPGHTVTHAVPIGAKYLTTSQATGCVYLEVDPRREKRGSLILASVATGRQFKMSGARYLGLHHDGAFVWHIYGNLRSAERKS